MASFNSGVVLNAHIQYPEHKVVFVENLLKCFVQQELLDLVFICDKNIRVFAHKIVFASVSRFLSDIIHNNGQDVVYISLPDVDHNKLQILLNVLYKGVTGISYKEMIILREIMVFLDIKMVFEVIPANTIMYHTPVCMEVKKENDLLSEGQSAPPCVGPKVEKNADSFSNGTDNMDFASGYMNMLTENVINTNVLNGHSDECSESIDKNIVGNEPNSGETVKDDISMEVTDFESKENQVFDSASDNDSNEADVYTENEDNDCEAIMEIAVCPDSNICFLPEDSPVESQDTSNPTSSEVFRDHVDSCEVTDNDLIYVNITTKNNRLSSIFISADQASCQNVKSPFATEDKNSQITSNIDLPINNNLKHGQKIDIDKQTSAQLGTTHSEFGKSRQSKRSGYTLSLEKRKILEEEYSYNKCPTKMEMSELAKELNVDYDTVWLWYNHHKSECSITEETEMRNRESTTYNIGENSEDSQDSSGDSEDSQDSSYTDKSIGSRRSGTKMKNMSLSEHQKEVLEAEYKKGKFPNKEVILRLRNELQLPFKKIQTWFGFRRYKEKSAAPSRNEIYGLRMSKDQREILQAKYRKEKLEKEPKNQFLNKEQKDKLGEDKKMKTNCGKYPDFTKEQLNILEESFKSKKKPTVRKVMGVAKQLNVPGDRVMLWLKKRGASDGRNMLFPVYDNEVPELEAVINSDDDTATNMNFEDQICVENFDMQDVSVTNFVGQNAAIAKLNNFVANFGKGFETQTNTFENQFMPFENFQNDTFEAPIKRKYNES